jgi:P pilus assembly chaperone PapD
MKRNIFTLKALLLMMLMSWVFHGHAQSSLTETNFITPINSAQTTNDLETSTSDMQSALAESFAEHSHNHHAKDHWHESLFMPNQSGFQSLELLDKQRDRSLYFIPEAPVFRHDKPPRNVTV